MRRHENLVLLILLWCLVAGIIGFSAGVFASQAKLPTCQEDEYLYPADDGEPAYEGPGEAWPGQYECFSFDDTFMVFAANGEAQECTVWDGFSETIVCTPENGKPYVVNVRRTES